MVSVGVSALGTTSIHFIEHGVKVNGQYYREDLLMQNQQESRAAARKPRDAASVLFG